MDSVLSFLAGQGRESVLERAYTDAVEQVDDKDETRTRVLDAAYEQF
ncbi:TetR/AcrR family transcriptional regulator, partial [Micromonospora aurantiaca]|nr:TetR/AcrR family transcriptional regulator [Micromonospora aurantiaca]